MRLLQRICAELRRAAPLAIGARGRIRHDVRERELCSVRNEKGFVTTSNVVTETEYESRQVFEVEASGDKVRLYWRFDNGPPYRKGCSILVRPGDAEHVAALIIAAAKSIRAKPDAG